MRWIVSRVSTPSNGFSCAEGQDQVTTLGMILFWLNSRKEWTVNIHFESWTSNAWKNFWYYLFTGYSR